MRPLDIAWSVLKADPAARLHDGRRHQTIHPGALAYMRRQKELSHIPGYQEGEMPYTQISGGPAMMTIAGDPDDYYADRSRDVPSVMGNGVAGREMAVDEQMDREAQTPHETMIAMLNRGYNPEEVTNMPTFQDSTKPQIGNPDGVQMLPYGNQFIPDFRQQQLEEFTLERLRDRLADFYYNGSNR